MLTLVLCAALAAEPAPEQAPQPPLEPMRFDHPVTTPVFLPRYASIGLYVNEFKSAFTVKVGWEITVYDDFRNLLFLIVELGPGFGLGMPAGVKQLWEHSAIGGLGYRWGKEKGFSWGFLIGGGALLEGAIFDPPVQDAGPRRKDSREEWVLGYVEGRAHAGWDFGPIIAGLAIGYGHPLSTTDRFPTSNWVGGFTFGVYLNWR